MDKKKLTLILTLRGREAFSERFFNYIKSIKLPYKLLIGDGDPSSNVKNIINKIDLSDIDYQYINFNDKTNKDYFQKILTLIDMAETPYVMLCDNDDYLILHGVNKSISFLDYNLDYGSCGGVILGFNCTQKNGKNHIFREQITEDYSSIDLIEQQNILNRVTSYIGAYNTTAWYNVFRKEILFNSFNQFIKLDINDLILMEHYITFASNITKRHHFDPGFVHYLRQANSSSCNRYIKSHYYRLIYNQLGQEILIMINGLARQICMCDKNVSYDKAKEEVAKSYILFHEKGQEPIQLLKTIYRNTVPDFIKMLRSKFSLFNYMWHKREYRKILSFLKNNGCSMEDQKEFEYAYALIKSSIITHVNAHTRP